MMEIRWGLVRKMVAQLVFLAFIDQSSASLSPTGVNYEVVALMAIKSSLHDPHNSMENWDTYSVDPCSWRMVTCSSNGNVSILSLPGLNLSGTLSPDIEKLSNLQSILLQNNAISGPIPETIGNLEKLQALDLSNNTFNGEVPSSLGNLINLNYLRLNNNNLSGSIPETLSNIDGLTLLDVSYNNLSRPMPKVSARTFRIVGNPLICGETTSSCTNIFPKPLSYVPDNLKDQSENGRGSHRMSVALSSSLFVAFVFMLVIGSLFWWRYQHNQQVFFDINDQYDPDARLGHLKRYSFKELWFATDHFSSKNILGSGGFGVVYKGILSDGTVVAVKRLKDYNAVGGEIQFQTEVELISLAVHRNLLNLFGFCSTEAERMLIYPYMPNGSVASRLRDYVRGSPVLDWSRRKRIALGTARGLVYLHEQCDPKIIHRDVKAANILLDEDFEAVVGDFGLAKLLDRHDSHVTTAVRGTIGHIAPEYLSTGQSSEKTDVFGFGVLLLELITGQKALDFGRGANQNGIMLDWVNKLHLEGKLNLMVDKNLKANFDSVELEEMVQVALLCTQMNPSHRPKMSEVVRMLDGEGLAEKWEASQKVRSKRFQASNSAIQRYSDFIEESHIIEDMELSGPR